MKFAKGDAIAGIIVSSAASTWRSTGGAGHPTNSRGVGRVARLAGEAIGIVGDGPRVVIEWQGYADYARR
jgi:hypothetical protein